MRKFKHLAFIGCLISTTWPLSAQNKTDTSKQQFLRSADSTRSLKSFIISARTPAVDRQIDKTVINIGQNSTFDGLNVIELIKKLPGVQVTPDGQISLNGKAGVEVYIDGKPTYLSAEDLSGLLSSISAGSVQKVELMTNPSARYDAAGTGGIINIVKKRSHSKGWTGSFNTGITQAFFNKYNSILTINHESEKFGFYVSAGYTNYKNYRRTAINSQILDVNNFLITEQVSGNITTETAKTFRPTFGLDYYLSKRATLSFSGTAGTGISDNHLTSKMDIRDSSNMNISHVDYTSGLRDRPFNYTAGVQFTQKMDTLGGSLTLSADRSGYHNSPIQNNYNYFSDPIGNPTGQMIYLLRQQRSLNIFALKADFIKPFAGNMRLETGIKSSNVKAINDNNYYDQDNGLSLFDPTQSNYSVNIENINAAYFNVMKKYKNLALQGGLRAEQTLMTGSQMDTDHPVNENDLQIFPTLFLDYVFNDQHSFNLKVGRRIERAAYNELVPFRRPQTATLFFQGNPNLKPQISSHSELTWAFRKIIYITFNYDLYRDYIRTLPFADSNKTTITRTPINIQRAHLWDLDLAFAKKINAWWSTDNSGSAYLTAFSGYAHHTDLDNNGIVSFSLTSNNSFIMTKELSAELDYSYDSRRQFVNSTFGAYSILTLGFRLQILDGNGSVSLTGHNLLQREDHNAIDRTIGFYQYADLHFYTRSIGLGFNYRFGKGTASHTKFNSGSSDERGRAGN